MAKRRKPSLARSTRPATPSTILEGSSTAGITPALRWLGPMLVVLASALMLHLSWRKWPDVLIDFGRELYIPWQLACGKVLYTDIAYFSGPLSPYWNGLWFYLFGPGLMKLVAVNLVLLAVLLVLKYRLLIETTGHLGATAACTVFVLLFSFSQFVGVGNYNFVCPYSHEMTHGTLLAMAAITCLWRYHCRKNLAALAVAGLMIGFLALTKAEVFLAGGAATVTSLVLMLWLDPLGWRRLTAAAGLFVAGVVAPPLVAWGLLAIAMPADAALRSTLGSWPYLFNREAVSLKFYLDSMGIARPWESALDLLQWSAGYAALFVPVSILGLLLRRPGWHRPAIAAGVGVITAVVLWNLLAHTNWINVALPLPLAMLTLCVLTLNAFFRARHDRAAAGKLLILLALIIFAFIMLLKIALNARIIHYGFALAMPASIILVATLTGWIPRMITRSGGYGGTLGAAAFAAIAVVAVLYLNLEAGWYASKTTRVGSSADCFFADERGWFVDAALAEMNRRVGPSQTVAVLPEGAMINYLARRTNSTPYLVFMPLEVIIFGEERMLEAFQEHPPDFVLLVHKDTSEYGYRHFGRDYAQQLFRWVNEHYRQVWLAGFPPLTDDRFGVSLLQHQ